MIHLDKKRFSQLFGIFLLGLLFLPQPASAAQGVRQGPVVIHVKAANASSPNELGQSQLCFEDAIEKIKSNIKASGVPTNGVELILHEGRYSITQPIELDQTFQGNANSPIVIRAAEGEHVVFDGSLPLDPTGFQPVRDPQERKRLAAGAVDQIVVSRITNPQIIAKLSQKVVLGLVVDGVTYFPSRFPNQGYAQLAAQPLQNEITPPAVPIGKENYGVRAGHPPYQEEGRRQGWLGSLTEPRGAQVELANRKEEMAGTWEQWQAELAHDNTRNQLTGFLDANWLLRSQTIYSADALTRSIRLSEALAYGWGWRNKDKPFHIFGFLCEIDHPGEWHFDARTQKLYLYPPYAISAETKISIPVATGFLRLHETRYVSVIGLNVENIAGGNVYHIEGGSHNLIAGATVSNSTACGVRISGTRQTVRSCNFVDLDHHVVLAGGRREPDRIRSGNNSVENCHIYQRSFHHRRVSVSISGVGQRFRNNLIHNSLGQAVTIRGNDHLLELNELFNIGYEEGDGGAMYSGADLAGYGVVYRHNFFHHLMHVPGKVERSGIHLDDLQAGATCIGNIFFKSAGKGIFMNGGAGHTILDNVFLSGYRGAYNVGHTSRQNHDRQVAILSDPHHNYRHTKENYVGRTEKVVGKQGWAKEPWKSRYPLFYEVMKDTGLYGRMWPIRCRVENNLYFGNIKGNLSIWSRVAPEAQAKSWIRGDRVISPSDFIDYDALDLEFRQNNPSIPRIPFSEIGLYPDRYRRKVPDKGHYRSAIRRHFLGIPSMPGTRKRIDTAKLIENGPWLTR